MRYTGRQDIGAGATCSLEEWAAVGTEAGLRVSNFESAASRERALQGLPHCTGQEIYLVSGHRRWACA